MRAFERYKEICEHRILELCPGHPLPVTEDDLGKGNAEIDVLRDQLQNLQYRVSASSPHTLQGESSVKSPDSTVAMRHHLDTISFKNSQLEKALREETLANEE